MDTWQTLTKHAFFLPPFQKHKSCTVMQHIIITSVPCQVEIKLNELIKARSMAINSCVSHIVACFTEYDKGLSTWLTVPNLLSSLSFTVEKCFNRRNRPVHISARDSHPFQVQPLSPYCTPMSNKIVGKCRKFFPFFNKERHLQMMSSDSGCYLKLPGAPRI